jgi:hypothetical protein
MALDILVQTSSGGRVLVEMQAPDHKWFRERAVYYASRTHGNQVHIGCRLILDDNLVNVRGGIDERKRAERDAGRIMAEGRGPNAGCVKKGQ